MLLDKLESYGIRGIANQWFQSYLSNRTQFVEVTHLVKKYTQNKYLSSLRKNSSGVPQGCILGPIPFQLYINDLPKYVQDVQMVLYSDNINILVVDKDENTLTCKIAYLMNHLKAWFNNSVLILNIRKSCALSFHPRQRELVCKPSIFYNGADISYKTVVKFLGINITESLKWHTHINSLCSSLS
jgi:hypothetical protein